MKRFFTLILTVILLLIPTSLTVHGAKGTLSKSIDLPLINDDSFGDGYEWDNLDCVLKLNGINLNTADLFGIKLPAGSTVELSGDNYIKASKHAIYCLGEITFTGKGSLTLVAEDTGISCFTTLVSDSIVFRGGNITVNGTKNGIYSESAPIVFSGSTVTVNATDHSVYGRDIKFVSGDASLNGGVYAKGTLTVSNANLSVSSSSSALTAVNGITLTDVTLSVGATLSSLNSAQSYNGESAIKTAGTRKIYTPSFLFGDGVSIAVDYLIIALVTLGLTAIIVVPIIINRKKTAELIKTSSINKKTKTQKNNK